MTFAELCLRIRNEFPASADRWSSEYPELSAVDSSWSGEVRDDPPHLESGPHPGLRRGGDHSGVKAVAPLVSVPSPLRKQAGGDPGPVEGSGRQADPRPVARPGRRGRQTSEDGGEDPRPVVRPRPTYCDHRQASWCKP